MTEQECQNKCSMMGPHNPRTIHGRLVQTRGWPGGVPPDYGSHQRSLPATIRGSKGRGSMADAAVEPIGWERALMAAEKVKERLRRATKALDGAGVPYAV